MRISDWSSDVCSSDLFSDPQDPTSAPNGNGVPYSLNTKLFSDYAVKYRIAYLPESTKSVYRDAKADGTNAVLYFPSVTLSVKTVWLRVDTTQNETTDENNPTIKRENKKGTQRPDR